MSWLIDSAYYIVPFIILLGILVFVHEFGHFLVARMCGVAVSEFSIGFGKKLWGRKDKSGTEWRIGAIPLGGYCKFLGDDDAASGTGDVSSLSEEDKKRAFSTQNPFKKLAIVVAGPAANYVFAILIFASIFFFLGKIDFPPVVGDIIKGGAAEAGGVLKGDRIISINGKQIKSFSQIAQEVAMHTGGDIKLEIKRHGEIIKKSFPLKTVPLTVEPKQTNPNRPLLGIRSINVVEVEDVDLSLWQSFSDATYEAWRITVVTLRGISQMITGQRSADEVGGIIRIAEMSGDITKTSGFIDFVAFMALYPRDSYSQRA